MELLSLGANGRDLGRRAFPRSIWRASRARGERTPAGNPDRDSEPDTYQAEDAHERAADHVATSQELKREIEVVKPEDQGERREERQH